MIEGGEGAGKSTQAKMLATYLRSKRLSVVETREPGGTPVGERIRDVLLGGDLKVPASTELLLILAARSALVQQVVKPKLELGHWIVSDRFDMSTYAYQGYGRGVPLKLLGALNHYVTGGLQPDLYVVLDLPVEEGLARHARSGKSKDRFESGGADFLKRVSEGYVDLTRFNERAVAVPAGGTVVEVAEQVQRVVHARLARTA